ncbi:hypothetical protein EYS10_25625 [Rahnella aquatilis]|nr:hypothetical protein EYS10_25625 [Rahnella aquatilis]
MCSCDITPELIAVNRVWHWLLQGGASITSLQNNVQDKSALKTNFRANIAFKNLFRGISSFSDAFFFIKLVSKLL